MELLPTIFDSCSVLRARKAYKYLFQEPHRNGETIAKLANYLTVKTAEAKETWKHAYERYTKKQTYFEALKAKYENLKRS